MERRSLSRARFTRSTLAEYYSCCMQVAGLAHDAMHALPLRTGTPIQAGGPRAGHGAWTGASRVQSMREAVCYPCLVCYTSAWPLPTSWLFVDDDASSVAVGCRGLKPDPTFQKKMKPDLMDRRADAHGDRLGHWDSRSHCRQRTKGSPVETGYPIQSSDHTFLLECLTARFFFF